MPQDVNDPSTWAWADNAPLVMADYFAHPDGFGGGYDNVNWANIAAEADIADEPVDTRSGETIAIRWPSRNAATCWRRCSGPATPSPGRTPRAGST
jgi:hypothetical protein